MKKIIVVAACTLLIGCSVALVYAPKTVEIRHSKGVDADIALTGSDLRDAKAEQSADGTLPVSVTP